MIGLLIDAPVAQAAAVFVDARIAAATGLGISEQWGVGTQQMAADPFAGPEFPGFVGGVATSQRLAIVALHTWLEIGDHNAQGHNFLRGGPNLYSIDHCTALGRILADPTAQSAPVTLLDHGALLVGIAPDDPARTELKERILLVTRMDIEAAVAQFPDDHNHPWITADHCNHVVNWIVARQGGSADAIAN